LKEISSLERVEINNLICSIGGWLDGGFDGAAGSLLIFTIPFEIGFGRIERVMEEVASKFMVDRWMYGNVYDAKDGVTPLNWWKKN
jgi:hypothetical protein